MPVLRAALSIWFLFKSKIPENTTFLFSYVPASSPGANAITLKVYENRLRKHYQQQQQCRVTASFAQIFFRLNSFPARLMPSFSTFVVHSALFAQGTSPLRTQWYFHFPTDIPRTRIRFCALPCFPPLLHS